jgi:hypothetical protein
MICPGPAPAQRRHDMKPVGIFLAVAAAIALLRHSARRLARHQRIMPRLTSRVNTQVHRINQP